MDLITQSQFLARNLATHCIKKLLVLNSSAEQMQSQKEQNQPGTPMDQSVQSSTGLGPGNAGEALSIRSERYVFTFLVD